MKKFLWRTFVLCAILLTLWANKVLAVEPEIGLGWANTGTLGDGTWYQDGLPHTLKLNTPAWQAGLSETLSARWRLHEDFVSPGVVHSFALATTDANYNLATRTCRNSPCSPIATYSGEGSAPGLKLSVEYLASRGLGVEAGPYLYRPVWRETTVTVTGYAVGPGYVNHADNIPNLHIGLMVGIGAHFGNLRIGVDEYLLCLENRCRSEVYNPIWDNITIAGVTWRFGK